MTAAAQWMRAHGVGNDTKKTQAQSLVRFGHHVTGFMREKDSVALQVVVYDNGAQQGGQQGVHKGGTKHTKTVRAQYVVAADGANSCIRYVGRCVLLIGR